MKRNNFLFKCQLKIYKNYSQLYGQILTSFENLLPRAYTSDL